MAKRMGVAVGLKSMSAHNPLLVELTDDRGRIARFQAAVLRVRRGVAIRAVSAPK